MIKIIGLIIVVLIVAVLVYAAYEAGCISCPAVDGHQRLCVRYLSSAQRLSEVGLLVALRETGSRHEEGLQR